MSRTPTNTSRHINALTAFFKPPSDCPALSVSLICTLSVYLSLLLSGHSSPSPHVLPHTHLLSTVYHSHLNPLLSLCLYAASQRSIPILSFSPSTSVAISRRFRQSSRYLSTMSFTSSRLSSSSDSPSGSRARSATHQSTVAQQRLLSPSRQQRSSADVVDLSSDDGDEHAVYDDESVSIRDLYQRRSTDNSQYDSAEHKYYSEDSEATAADAAIGSAGAVNKRYQHGRQSTTQGHGFGYSHAVNGAGSSTTPTDAGTITADDVALIASHVHRLQLDARQQHRAARWQWWRRCVGKLLSAAGTLLWWLLCWVVLPALLLSAVVAAGCAAAPWLMQLRRQGEQMVTAAMDEQVDGQVADSWVEAAASWMRHGWAAVTVQQQLQQCGMDAHAN